PSAGMPIEEARARRCTAGHGAAASPEAHDAGGAVRAASRERTERMNWKHAITILTGTALPALITALAGHPLTWATLAQAMGAAVTVTVAVYLRGPAAVPRALLCAA